MAHPLHHAESSVRRFGGQVSDYIDIHQWLEVIWTIKPLSFRTEAVVPVVHGRGPAARGARSRAQRSGRRGGTCGPTGATAGPHARPTG
jgi:hypothetical protein